MEYKIKRLIRDSNLPAKTTPIVTRLFNQMDDVQAGDSCLSLSVAMCVAFAYIGIESDVKLGQIVVAGEPFYHAWLEVNGNVIDIAIYGNIKYSNAYRELSNKKVLSVMPQINKSYQDVDDNIEYFPNKFDDDFELSPLSVAYKMPILTYCDGAPNNGMWTSILRALQIPRTDGNMKKLRQIIGDKVIGI